LSLVRTNTIDGFDLIKIGAHTSLGPDSQVLLYFSCLLHTSHFIAFSLTYLFINFICLFVYLQLYAARVEGGRLLIGSIQIGQRCYIGTRACVSGGVTQTTIMEDDAQVRFPIICSQSFSFHSLIFSISTVG
jgi:acetyltransferase-like isoleucine patch superfamily enzyme